MIIASPKLSARPAANSARPSASARPAPLTWNQPNRVEMRLASSIPIPVRAIQNPRVLSPTRPIDPAEKSPVSCRPTTMVSASMPRTSSSTAAPSMVTPSGVARLWRSPSTRTEMPMDVAVSTAPMNSALTSVRWSA